MFEEFRSIGDTIPTIYGVNATFMFLNFLAIFMAAFRFPPDRRLFHYLLSHISLWSSTSYVMLSNDILTFRYGDRIIYNARYIDWVVNTPIQLIVLGKMGRISDANLYILTVLDIIMIVAGWIGELTDHALTRWILFMIGMTSIVPIYVFLFSDFDYSIVREFSGEYIANRYYWIGRYVLFVWIFYPLVWALDNIFHHISVFQMCVSYTVLDFFAKVVFIWWIFYCVQYRPGSDSENPVTDRDEPHTSIVVQETSSSPVPDVSDTPPVDCLYK